MFSYNILKNIIKTALVAVFMISCGDSSTEGGDNPSLQVSVQTISAESSGNSVSVNIISNVAWTARSNASYVSVSPESGNGSGTMLVTIEANTTAQERNAVITVTPKGGTPVMITVVQLAMDGKYTDNEYVVYQKSTKSNPFVIVFTGDGYTEDMFAKGAGKFDKDLNKAIEHLFSIEPYKTYRNYFTVYKIAAYSKEAGVSVKRPVRKYKNTRFKCMWENIDESGSSSTLIEGDMNAVKEVWSKIPGLSTDAAQTYSPICVIINEEIRAGTVEVLPKDLSGVRYGGLDIKTVSMIPLGNEKQSFESLVQHELGGHGIGMLSDEYAFSAMGEIPEALKNKLIDLQGYGSLGFGWNLTFSESSATAPWAQFLSVQKYVDQGTGMYEGGMNYSKGVWRPSWDSCMKNNKPYFNVQSRWLIYKRIKMTVGESYSLSDFMENDNETQYESESPSGSQPTPLWEEVRNHVSF